MKPSLLIKTGALALIVISQLACQKKNNDTDSTSSLDPVEASLETGISMISGMSDDQAGGSLAMSPIRPRSLIAEGLFPLAHASTSCSRPITATCSSGVRALNYDGCTVASTSRTMNGSANLTYSDNSCALSTNGDTVTRTMDIEISGPRGGVYSLSSDSQADYNGNIYGGGGRITKTSGGWNLDILGRHSSFTYKGKSLASVSVRTLSAMQVTGSLSRSSRVVSGGQLEVNHNLSGFTALITPSNLEWSSICCHPVSGSLSVTYSGSKSGSATVSFNGCGAADVTSDGQTKSIEFSYCE